MVYKALSTPARRQLLELIEQLGPIDLKSLSAETGMKETTLRHHLLVLERSGLVLSEEGHGGVPGRPPMIYKIPARHWDLGFPKRQYAILAEKLLSRLVEENGDEVAVELMRGIGQESAQQIIAGIIDAKGNDDLGPDDVEEFVIPALNAFGSATKVVELSEERISIRMNNCIFFELALSYPDLICEGHAALFETLGAAFGGMTYEKGGCLAEGDVCCVSNLVRKDDDPR